MTKTEKMQNKEIKVCIITMGLSRIVKPIVSKYNVVSIVECASRKTKIVSVNGVYKILKNIYRKFSNECTLKSFSAKHNIPYYYMDNGSDLMLESWIKKNNPDVIIVYSMSQLLKENIFSIPKYGTINLHMANLPNYRGPNPDFWIYYNQEEYGGVTVHYVDKGEDTGDIIYQDFYKIPLGMKSKDMLDLAIGKIGVNLLIKVLENIDCLPRSKQPNQSPTPRAINIPLEKHDKIIDWDTWSIERIWHLLRGTECWLNAIEQPSGIFKGHRWIVRNYVRCKMPEYYTSKIYKEKNRYFVACKEGKIFLDLKLNFKILILNLFS